MNTLATRAASLETQSAVIPTLINEFMQHLVVQELQIIKICLSVKLPEMVTDFVFKFRKASFARTIFQYPRTAAQRVFCATSSATSGCGTRSRAYL